MNIKDKLKEIKINAYVDWATTGEEDFYNDLETFIKDLLSQSNQEILDRVGKEVIGIVISESYPFDIVLSKPTLKTLLDLQIKKLEQLKLSIINKE
jgi:hypothetical protein